MRKGTLACSLKAPWPRAHDDHRGRLGHRRQGLLWALATWKGVLCTFPGPPWVSGCTPPPSPTPTPEVRDLKACCAPTRQDDDRTWWLLWADSQVPRPHLSATSVTASSSETCSLSATLSPTLVSGHTPGSAAPRLPLEGALLGPGGQRRDTERTTRLLRPGKQPQNQEAELGGR